MSELTLWFAESVQWLVALVEQLGVGGIFIMAFVESTFVPVPSEMVIIPAGYLIQQGKLPLIPVFAASVIGTIGGAFFNYWLARHLGRRLFLRFGKYFLMTPEKLAKLETFFANHGAISTFVGRLIPGIRHYIPFPAGLARMDRAKFIWYTALGGGLWMGILLALGYFIGANQQMLMIYLPWIKVGIALFIGFIVLVYIFRHGRTRKKNGTI